MADNVQSVQHFGFSIKDEVGAGARVLKTLRDNDVDLIAVWAYPYGTGTARVEVVPKDAAGFAAAAKAAGLDVAEPTTAFYVTGDDRSGAIAEAFEKLARVNVSVEASQAVSDGRGHFGAVIYVAPADIQRAATALDAT